MDEQGQITLRHGDGRDLGWIADESVHLVVTSPPYWTLKDYNDHPGQLGHVEIGKEDHARWFRSMWTDVPGASTKNHPAPFPLELAGRLVRMFSFVGDTVLDPFAGTGTTVIAAVSHRRNAIGVEVDPKYYDHARQRIEAELILL